MDVLHGNVKEEKGPKKIPKYNQIYTNIYKIHKIYTKYQSAARRRPASSHFVYILYILYIFDYIVVFFWCHNHAEKIPKYSQIYSNIYKYIQDSLYILVYICVYIYIYFFFVIFSAWLRHRALYGPRPFQKQ